jgi:predicted N-acetyltransferase YhbS
MVAKTGITIPQHVGEAAEVNYSGAPAADFGPLARDKIPVRSMTEGDLRALVTIDRRITGRDRAAYFQRKLADALTESDVCVSLVAELDGGPVGFIMARVDLGEFGRVDPDYQNKGVGRALVSQLLTNLGTLRVEKVRTEVDWQDHDLLAYLDRNGFLPAQQLCFDQPLG